MARFTQTGCEVFQLLHPFDLILIPTSFILPILPIGPQDLASYRSELKLQQSHLDVGEQLSFFVDLIKLQIPFFGKEMGYFDSVLSVQHYEHLMMEEEFILLYSIVHLYYKGVVMFMGLKVPFSFNYLTFFTISLGFD